jgi:hypothetical protein
MALCSKPLTEPCDKEVRRLVARVTEADLDTLAATDTAFKNGGFRPGKPDILRVRLAQIVCGGGNISDAVRRAVADRSRAKTLTGLLSESAICDMRDALAALLSAPVLLVALLLDSRPEVRAKAEEWMDAGDDAFQPLAPDAAAETLRSYFNDLQELSGAENAVAAPVQKMTREARDAQVEDLTRKLSELRVENRRMRGDEERARMYAQKLKKAEALADDAKARCETAEAASKADRNARLEAEAEVARETAHREERLAAAIDAALANEFFGWLGQARAVEREAAAQPGPDILARAESALHAQASIDRNSGNRATVSARLEQFKAAHRRVTDALANALRRAPELVGAERELAAEIARLEDLLSPEPAAVTPFESALETRIHEAEDNALPKLRQTLSSLASLEVLPAEAIARLQDAFRKRLAATQAVGVPEPDADEPAPRSEETAELGRALTGQEPLILLIDGHNVLFGLPVRYEPPRGKSITDAEKRDHLVHDIVKLVEPSPTMRAWIVFDGQTRTEQQAAPNVRVTYSGGQGEHRADGVLLDTLRFFKTASPDAHTMLVSNDRDLCTAARKLGAKTLPVLELGAFFSNTRGHR